MLLLLATFLAGNEVALVQNAAAQMAACGQQQAQIHYHDDGEARTVAENALQQCHSELESLHAALFAAQRSVAPSVAPEVLDAHWKDHVSDLVAALTIRVEKLRGAVPKDQPNQ